jgi:hypothetical protein
VGTVFVGICIMFVGCARSVFGGTSAQGPVPVVDLTSDKGQDFSFYFLSSHCENYLT